MRFAIVLVLAVGLFGYFGLRTESRTQKDETSRKVEPPATRDKEADHLSVTEHHQMMVHDQPLQYKATRAHWSSAMTLAS